MVSWSLVVGSRTVNRRCSHHYHGRHHYVRPWSIAIPLIGQRAQHLRRTSIVKWKEQPSGHGAGLMLLLTLRSPYDTSTSLKQISTELIRLDDLDHDISATLYDHVLAQ